MLFTGEFQLHKAGEVYLILNWALMKFLISETGSYALKVHFPVYITDFALFVKLYLFEYYIKLEYTKPGLGCSKSG